MENPNNWPNWARYRVLQPNGDLVYFQNLPEPSENGWANSHTNGTMFVFAYEKYGEAIGRGIPENHLWTIEDRDLEELYERRPDLVHKALLAGDNSVPESTDADV